MKQVFFIHGGSAYSRYDDFLEALKTKELRSVTGESSERWSDNLRRDLGGQTELFQPRMPNADNAQYQEWQIWFERHFSYLLDGVILVGWSLGGMFLAKYLLENDLPFRPSALLLLAAPAGSCASEVGEDCGTFQFDPGRIEELATKMSNIQIWHSEDDFVVPYADALVYQAALPQAKLVTFQDRNHFLLPQFPEFIEAIHSL